MIAIVDYGLGNVMAFSNIYRRLGIDVVVARTPSDLAAATKVVLPGVGAFDWAMGRLNASGLRDSLDEAVLGRRICVLGVCVGMQMMARRSEEGVAEGLGWIDGDVVRFDVSTLSHHTHLPHMGWNIVKPVTLGGLFRDIVDPQYYFLHSYFIRPVDPTTTLATSHYGQEFTSAVARDNIFGTQFHPEKSHGWGIDLLRNFAELTV